LREIEESEKNDLAQFGSAVKDKDVETIARMLKELNT